MSTTISVVIPAYNRADMLRLVVESVLGQSVPPLEIIIIDDGSTDHTSELVKREIDQKPGWRTRVRYFYQENKGISGALNAGIERARGEWIGFTAQDDLWLPWKLEWQLRALEKYKHCGLCFTDAWFMNNPFMKMSLFEFARKTFQGPMGEIENPVALVAGQHPVWTQTCIARTDLVREIGGYDPVLRYSEDHDFLFRLGLRTKFCYVGMPMVMIDRSPGDIRHVGEARNWHKEEFRLKMDQYRFERQMELGKDQDESTRAIIRNNLRSIHSSWANWYIEQDEYKKARASMAEALKCSFRLELAIKLMLLRVFPRQLKWFLVRDRSSAVRHDRVSWQVEDTVNDSSKQTAVGA